MLKTMMLLVVLTLSGCVEEADIVSQNLSTAADQFEISRRIVFYNGITDKYILVVKGRCSVNTKNKQLAVICKTNDGYVKHYLGLSDNVTYFSEQLQENDVSGMRYRVIFKPLSIIPNIQIK